MALYITSVLVAIAILVFLIFKGVNMVPASLIASLAAILIGGLNIWRGLSQGYGVTMGNYVRDFFLIFFLSALFGAVMSDSGAASKIASTLVNKIGKSSVILVLLVVTLILSYGGIMTYLVAFTLYPIAVVLFKEADIPIKLFPATILGIAATICMTTLPGSPQIQNIMPTKYFHTNIYAGATIGIVCGIYVFVANYLYLKHAQKKCQENGEHFVSLGEQTDIKVDYEKINFWLAITPILIMLILIFVLKNTLNANFSVVIAMFFANLSAFILFNKQLKNHFSKTIEKGTKNGVNALMTTSAVVAFGGVVTMSPQFTNIVKTLSNSHSNVYLISMLVVSIAAGISGSASGGIGIWLNSFGTHLATMNLNFGALHRLAVMSSGWTGCSPFSSGPVVASSVAHVKLKDSYPYIFITCVVNPFIAMIIGYLMFCIGLV